MTRGARLHPALETAAVLGLALAALYLALIPFDFAGQGIAGPDLAFCLMLAWVARRPASAPLWAILVVGLAGDALLSRPIGLGALALLLAAEATRANAAWLRAGSFLREWAFVAAAFALCLAGMRLGLDLLFAEGPHVAALTGHWFTTALAYPLAVALVALAAGVRAPGRAAGPGLRR